MNRLALWGTIFFILIPGALTLLGFIFMLLWNYVVPTYWAACPILTLPKAVATIALLIFISTYLRRTEFRG